MKTRCRVCKRIATTRYPCRACGSRDHLIHTHDTGLTHTHDYTDPFHQHLAAKGQSWVA